MSYWTEIYSYEALNDIIHNGTIKESFWVNSTMVNKLEGVREIRAGENGTVHFQNLTDIGDLEYVDCDFSFFGNIQSLGNLKYVGGELRFGAPLKSLGVLEEIKGDFRPTTNDLTDLGRLSKVGGTLDLKGMINIVDLSLLREIGGNLNLVKSLKDQYDLSKLKVQGRVVYWNKSPEYFVTDNPLDNSRTPPSWENLGPFEFENNLVVPNRDQLEFYNYFKDSFHRELYVDVSCMRNYIRYFIYEILRDYNTSHDFANLVLKYKLLKEHYPNLSHDCEAIEVEIGRKLGIKKYQETVLPYEEWNIWKNFIQQTVKSNPCRIKPKDRGASDQQLAEILEIGFVSGYLTAFGKENKEAIFIMLVELIRKLEDRENSIFSRNFFDKNKYYKTEPGNGAFDPHRYKDFFESADEFELYLNEHKQRMIGMPPENAVHPTYILLELTPFF